MEKGPRPPERTMTFASLQLREPRAMREIRLLTETSTQIRISALPKASRSALLVGARNNYRKSLFLQVFMSQRLGLRWRQIQSAA
jgi:hypothetical protein